MSLQTAGPSVRSCVLAIIHFMHARTHKYIQTRPLGSMPTRMYSLDEALSNPACF